MTSKLKTLKDLETSYLKSTTPGKGWVFVNVRLLEQEAIKLINEIDKGMIVNCTFPSGKDKIIINYDLEGKRHIFINDKKLDKESCKEILKYFLNITGGDLKQKEKGGEKDGREM